MAGAVASGLGEVGRRLTPYSNHLSIERFQRKGMYVGGYLMIVKTYCDYFGNSDFTEYLGNSTHYTCYD